MRIGWLMLGLLGAVLGFEATRAPSQGAACNFTGTAPRDGPTQTRALDLNRLLKVDRFLFEPHGPPGCAGDIRLRQTGTNPPQPLEGSGSAERQTAPGTDQSAQQAFSVALEGFTTRAVLDFPAGQRGPWATVLLLHAGYPSDLDASFIENGQVISQNFLAIARALSAQGFAVARYNKRFVNSASDYDTARYERLSLDDFAADARAVLRALRANPRVERTKLFVLGWSQGATVAMRVALEEPELRGLALIGPPVVVAGVDYGTLELAGRLRLPTIFLQGLNDTITLSAQTRQLEAALRAHAPVTAHYYDHLGHGLGEVGAPLYSQFAPITAAPLRDLTRWLNTL